MDTPFYPESKTKILNARSKTLKGRCHFLGKVVLPKACVVGPRII